MLKRHEITVLLKAGHSQAEVAQLAGVSLRSVKRAAKEDDVEHVTDVAKRLRDAPEDLRRGPGRREAAAEPHDANVDAAVYWYRGSRLVD